ncbi:hypothetical protein L195_g060742 [Trifolium pratense]|uniref:Uncharacterized protein n=1 Tax=Trifolium pratense TaxID=57577 RepID=A0A2K3K5S3_TRIPR|nr:hypothetical protein L195_g060742 [Trifolium pratense]
MKTQKISDENTKADYVLYENTKADYPGRKCLITYCSATGLLIVALHPSIIPAGVVSITYCSATGLLIVARYHSAR